MYGWTSTTLLLLLPVLTLLTAPVDCATTLKLSKHNTQNSRLTGAHKKLQQRTIERRSTASSLSTVEDEQLLKDRAIHLAMHPHPHANSATRPRVVSARERDRRREHGRYRRNEKKRLDQQRHSPFSAMSGVWDNIIGPDRPTGSVVGDGGVSPDVGVGNVIVSSVYRTVTKTVRPTATTVPTGVPSVDNPEDLILENTGGLAYTIDVVVQGVAIPVIVDTGSSQFWVPAATCANCSLYGMTLSPIQVPVDCKIKNNTYGIGSSSGCFTHSDISVGSYQIPDMNLMGITDVDPDLGSSGTVLSGILGLAGETNAEGSPTLVKAMYDLGLIKYKTVGFFLSEDDDVESEITFGDVTTSEHADASQGVVLQSVPNDMNLYEVVMDDFRIGHKSVVTGETVVVDTGSSYIYVPEAIAKQIYSLLPSPLKAENGYIIPCTPSNPPNLHFVFGGMDFHLDYKYIVGPIATSDGYCWGKIGSLTNVNSWVIGDAFLHTVYTSFNVGTREVTLYKLK